MNGRCQGASSGAPPTCRNITNSLISKAYLSCLRQGGRIFSSPVSYFLQLLFARCILVPLVQAANRIQRLFRLHHVPTSFFCGSMLCSRSCLHQQRRPSC